MEDQKTITYEEVEERLKNKNFEDYTYDDVFDRYVAYGEDYELAQVEVQKLFVKRGMIGELVWAVESIITDKSIIESITSSEKLKEEYILINGSIKSIDIAQDKELPPPPNAEWLIINFIDNNNITYKIKQLYFPKQQNKYKSEIEQRIDKNVTIVANELKNTNECRLCCILDTEDQPKDDNS